MSIARIRSFAFSGIEAVPVEVQVQIASGLPAFLVVGLPDKAVAEARERVRAALTAMGLSLPPLIKGYLRLGGFVGDGAVIDAQFNTTDVAIVVKTDLVTDKYYRHYERQVRDALD